LIDTKISAILLSVLASLQAALALPESLTYMMNNLIDVCGLVVGGEDELRPYSKI
jgi:hypothetical protein